MKELYKNYMRDNKQVLIGYGIVTLVFYIINFIFYRNHMDAPVDAIFAMIYIIFTPGIVLLITMIKGNHHFRNNATFFRILLVHMLGPVIISLLFTIIYALLQNNINQWLMVLSAYMGTVPILLIGFILAVEIKYVIKGLWIRIVILVGVLITYYLILVLFDNMDYLYIISAVHILVIFVLPILVVTTWYRSKCIF